MQSIKYCVCRRSCVERNFSQQHRFQVDALWNSYVEFHLRTSHVLPKGTADQGREKGNRVHNIARISEFVVHNLSLTSNYVALQSLIIGEKSSVRYVTYQNEEEDQ